ncbi:MAG: hypothetical protein ACK5NY_02230 [Burkholderiaceae bacterium]
MKRCSAMTRTMLGLVLFAGAVAPSYANRTGDIVGGLLVGGLVGASIANAQSARGYTQPQPVYAPAPVVIQQAPQCVYPNGAYGPCPAQAAYVAPVPMYAPAPVVSYGYYSPSPPAAVRFNYGFGPGWRGGYEGHRHHGHHGHRDWR